MPPILLDGTLGITTPSYGGADTAEYLVPVTGFKNRIINGAMVIDQRNAGASVTLAAVNPAYTLDRWAFQTSQASKISTQQNAGSVTPPVGFSNYLGVTSLSAYSVISTDYFTVQQRIEGYNVADLAWGTASAATVTLSFWVRSSLTGTFGGSLSNSAFNRSYPFTFTISSANTWEQKFITIAGDTSGTWLTTNSLGMYVSFSLGSGSTYSGTAGAWTGSGLLSATGATSVVGTNGATFYITGVQLEKGSTATSFDYRPYSAELALCQRYYNVYVNGGYDFQQEVNRYSLIGCSFTWWLPTIMRASPTIYSSTGTAGSYGRLVAYDSSINLFATPNVSAVNFTTSANNQSVCISLTNASLAATPYVTYDTAGVSVVLAATAEL